MADRFLVKVKILCRIIAYAMHSAFGD